MNTQTDWFTYWFNTPYYHILYKNRDNTDAKIFMQNITSFLELPVNSTILDLACGKGRHSVFLNSLQFRITGTDLSKNNIEYARAFSNDTLQFKVHDMRDPFGQTYDAIFNLFTSFGYFKKDSEDIKVLHNIKKGLAKDGIAVIDFLNVHGVKNNLVEHEVKIIDGIEFNIHREIKNGFIIKEIIFNADGKDHSYFERVKYIDESKFRSYFKNAGLQINHIFGDYLLNSFNPLTSDRLIFVVS